MAAAPLKYMIPLLTTNCRRRPWLRNAVVETRPRARARFVPVDQCRLSEADDDPEKHFWLRVEWLHQPGCRRLGSRRCGRSRHLFLCQEASLVGRRKLCLGDNAVVQRQSRKKEEKEKLLRQTQETGGWQNGRTSHQIQRQVLERLFVKMFGWVIIRVFFRHFTGKC